MNFSNGPGNKDDWPLEEGDYDVYCLCCFHNDVLAGPVNLKIDSGGRD